MAAERDGWYRIERLIRSLTPTECMYPGYFTDPDWSVRDLAAHLGTWLAEAGTQLERLPAGTYAGHDVDIEALNASFLAGHGRPALGRGVDPGHVWSVADARAHGPSWRSPPTRRRGGSTRPARSTTQSTSTAWRRGSRS